MSKKDEAAAEAGDLATAPGVDTPNADAGAVDTAAQAAEAASKQPFTREQLEAMGLDPAPYGL